MKKLETMTAEQLQSAPYAPVPFLVDELLPEGLHILAARRRSASLGWLYGSACAFHRGSRSGISR